MISGEEREESKVRIETWRLAKLIPCVRISKLGRLRFLQQEKIYRLYIQICRWRMLCQIRTVLQLIHQVFSLRYRICKRYTSKSIIEGMMTQNHRQETLHSSTKSSQPPQSVSRHLEMNVISNNLTREQIISLFSAGQEDSEQGPNV